MTKEDSSTIGFVLSCYLSGAISTKELQSWADHVLATSDEYPLYIIDLSEFDEPAFHVFGKLGFVPESSLGTMGDAAVAGIAYLRGKQSVDNAPRSDALRALERREDIRERFLRTFPFLSLPDA